MDSDALYSIGELARRTGLTVKTVRYYSDEGILPPTERSPAGYRLYGEDGRARLEMVRTLRDLGLGLATVRQVLDREVSLAEIARAHADALDVQIKTLRQRRAVLRAVARRGPTTTELNLMHRLARLSEAERHRLITDFIDDTFGGLDDNPEFVLLMRSAMPVLPDDPTAGQIEAWVELAELCQDDGFRRAIRRLAGEQAEDPSPANPAGLQDDIDRAVRARIDEARAAGILPASASATSRTDSLAALYAHAFEDADGGDLRRWLLARLCEAEDPSARRYWELTAAVNGWSVSAGLAPVFGWFTTALTGHY
ncbi:MerR family transcriptional regulator [Streptomyces tanashiensis]|uniref:helix-turn-helix domain-containing protein n=1 Tax=Streptomyces tanashiensis TaxID=67367 RepID=UPI0036EE375D